MLALALGSLSACGSDSSPGAAPKGIGEPDLPSVQVLLDDSEIARIPLDGLDATPTPLVDLLDGAGGAPASWILVEAKGPEFRQLQVRQQMLAQGNHLALSRNAAGTPRIGVYPTSNPLKPRLLLDDPVLVHLRTVEPPPAPPEVVEAVSLAFRVEGGPLHRVKDEEIDEIPWIDSKRIGGDGSRGDPKADQEGVAKTPTGEPSLRRAFHLADFLAAFVEVGAVKAVRLAPEQLDDALIVTAEQLKAEDALAPVFKRNSKGRWNYRQAGSDAADTRILRDIKLIEVQLR